MAYGAGCRGGSGVCLCEAGLGWLAMWEWQSMVWLAGQVGVLSVSADRLGFSGRFGKRLSHYMYMDGTVRYRMAVVRV